MSIFSENAVYFIVAVVIVALVLVWAYVTKRMQKDFSTMTWVLIPVAIAINIAIGQIVVTLKLPLYLDSIGTVLVAVICGPWAGALTGTLSNVIWGLTIDPNAFPWFPVAFFIGLVSGLMANAGWFKSWWKVAVTGFVVALTAAISSTPIAVYLYGGITASGSSFITAYLLQTGQGVVQAVLSTGFLVEPVDKITTAMLAYAIILGLSKRFVARFPRPENAEPKSGTSQRELIIALVLIIILVVVAVLMFTG